MNNTATITQPLLTQEQQRLLGGWLDILDDIRHLGKSLNSLPDGCRCGSGSAHLGGSCSCCQGTHLHRIPDCEDCDRLVAGLRPSLDTLTVDTCRFFPAFRDILHARCPESAQTDAADIQRHIAGIVTTFERLVLAADDFREGCRASHLGVLKERAADLLAQADTLDRALRGRDGAR